MVFNMKDINKQQMIEELVELTMQNLSVIEAMSIVTSVVIETYEQMNDDDLQDEYNNAIGGYHGLH